MRGWSVTEGRCHTYLLEYGKFPSFGSKAEGCLYRIERG